MKAFCEAADVVVAVDVVVDRRDDLGSGSGRLVRRAGRYAGRVAEVLEERSVEAVEDCEVAFVWVLLTLASSAADHLLEEDPGLRRAEEDDVLDVGDVDARTE